MFGNKMNAYDSSKILTQFQLSEDCKQSVHKWIDSHSCQCSLLRKNASDGKITWQFTPTSLGVITVVICACGERYDVSDYNNW